MLIQLTYSATLTWVKNAKALQCHPEIIVLESPDILKYLFWGKHSRGSTFSMPHLTSSMHHRHVLARLTDFGHLVKIDKNIPHKMAHLRFSLGSQFYSDPNGKKMLSSRHFTQANFPTDLATGISLYDIMHEVTEHLEWVTALSCSTQEMAAATIAADTISCLLTLAFPQSNQW